MKKLLSILTICPLLVSWGDSNSSSQEETTDSMNQEMQADQPADWEITLKVKTAILSDSSLSPGNRFVSVTTNDGVVTLKGKVSDRYQMNEIVKAAEKVEGVKKVDNQMSVE